MNAVVPDLPRSAGLVKYQGRPSARKSVSGIREYSHNTLLTRSAIRIDKGQKGGEEKKAIVALLVFILAIWIFFWGGGGRGGDNVFRNPATLINIIV